MTTFASPNFLSGLRIATAALALSLASCGSPEADASAEDDEDASADEEPAPRDAGKPRDAGAPSKSVKDAGTTTKPGSTRDAGASAADSGGSQPLIDASASGDPLGDLAGSVDWDQILGSDGGLFTPPGPASPDNPKECPETAPENPIGSCIGVPVYATCKYGNYTCLCDWIHWLCI